MTLAEYKALRPPFPAWDAEKNTLPADEVAPNSHRRAWWRCERGHSWRAAVFAVSEGTGCPYCAGRLPIAGETDLATTHPRLAAEWDAARNGALTPADVTCGSHRKVWWRCQAGHVWQAAVYSRTRERAAGCPVCTGRVKPQKRAGRLAPPEQERTHQFEEVRI